ncbi:hypothetical protein CQ10_39530 [Bradyrhizobium valentinum]|nr:hypothetical protein CQ10_39530 [Bradyrhizobium valentinum]
MPVLFRLQLGQFAMRSIDHFAFAGVLEDRDGPLRRELKSLGHSQFSSPGGRLSDGLRGGTCF